MPGIIKKNCWKYELHFSIQKIKRGAKEEPKEKINKTKKKKTIIDRMKEAVFKQEGKYFITYQKIQGLALNIGDKPFKEAQRFFEPLKFPKWQLDKAIKSDRLDVSRIKISDHLKSQSRFERNVLNGKDFLLNCKIHHRGWLPKGS